MSGVRRVLFGSVFFSFFPSAGFLSAGSEEQRSWISALLEVLSAIYDYDTSQIPDEPNEIFALRNSPSSRDQMAWALLNWLRMELDPNSRPYVEAIYPETALFSANEPTGSPDSLPKVETTALQENPELVEIVGIRTLGGESEPIEELAGPLGSCILEPKTYRITSLPVRIEGYVVIPAGTRLIAPYDPNLPVIEVMPGGRLDLGRAAFYEGDCPAVLPAVRIEAAESNNWFVNNAAGIYVHRGADPKTRIENLIITHCTAGIVLNETLETPLRWVIAVGCFDGLQLYAPAAVQDCEFWLNGSIFYGLLGYVGTGIYVVPDISSFPAFTVEIERTILYEGDIGLYIDEPWTDPNTTDPNTSDPNQLPEVRIRAVNSCFANSYFFGIYQRSGLTEAEIVHSAFWGNRRPVNFEGSFPGCIGLMADPLYNFPQEWEKLYILPDSELTDAGYGMADDGTGTAHDRPDTGILDIGCHFPVGVTGTFGIPSSPADFNWDGVVDEQDLALMEACMGATDDPNRVRMDLNADSWVNLPDFGIFATDYGYTADPNQPGLHDPNCARSDFSGDGMVNLEDLAIAAEHWLTAVFDEGRLCGLCNLYKDPNTPPGRQTIDDRDRNAFWAEWGSGFRLEVSVLFSDPNGSPMEPNMLSGLTIVQVKDYPISSRVFVQVDGQLAGQTYPDWEGEVIFEIPTYEYSNGVHRLAVGGYTPQGGCWLVPQTVRFDNVIFYASIPPMYEPNEPYELCGFFDGASVRVQAGSGEEAVYEGGWFRHQALFAAASEAAVSIGGEKASGPTTLWVPLSKNVDMSRIDPNSFRAVIIAPFERANRDFEISIAEIRACLLSKGISYIELLGTNANWDNIQTALCGKNLHYVYWIGHTNSQIGETRNLRLEVIREGTHRTNFKCWDKRKYWPFFVENRIFSCKRSDRLIYPPALDPLPSDWEIRGRSMWSLGLWKTKTIKEFWAIGCETGLEWKNANQVMNYNDMAYAVGAHYQDQQGNYVHVYMGTRTPIWYGYLVEQAADFPHAWAHILRAHSDRNLHDALLKGPIGSNEYRAVWGREGMEERAIQWWPLFAKLDLIYWY